MPVELPIRIIDVWKHNLEAEVKNNMSVFIEDYPFVAMDTEFPGKPIEDKQETDYANMKRNVDKLKIIQIGITLFNKDGNLPERNGEHLVWQLNFCEFDIRKDVSGPNSIKLLRKAGINFEKNLVDGITAKQFAEVIMNSGLVLNDNTRWVTFHGGYDFGYWIRMLSGKVLPNNEVAFYEKAKAFFPVFYDLKFVAACKNINKGGLEKLAEFFRIERKSGNPHQAGSDSLLTSGVYQALKNKCFKNSPMENDGFLYFR